MLREIAIFSYLVAISQKRWEIGPKLLLITNRKLCARFRFFEKIINDFE